MEHEIMWAPIGAPREDAPVAAGEVVMKTVNICGIPHDINLCEDKFDVDAHFGQIDYKSCEIRINKDLKGEAFNETLCHEILHGILIHIGRDDLSEDEQFVQCLANAINQTFRVKGEE